MQQNPLQQYFRRPSVYLKLPSGGAGYPEGVLDLPENGEIPIYPMTAIDEITARTPDALFNGTAVVEIIKSCAPNIKDPWVVSNVDLDPILVAIKTATHGGSMDISSDCPKCEETSKYTINLAGVLSSFTPGDYDTPLSLGENIKIKFKPLTFKLVNDTSVKQFQFQKAIQGLRLITDEEERNQKSKQILLELNSISIQMIAESIEYIKVPTATVMDKTYIVEFLNNIDVSAFDLIKNHSIKLKQSTESKPLKIKCVSCQHEYEQHFSINVSDFFE
jgi:hypothetical protein